MNCQITRPFRFLKPGAEGFILAFIVLFLSAKHAAAQEIREFMDLQIHPTMHFAYPFFGKGLQTFSPEKEPRLSYKHQFKNVNYANYFKNNPGARIWVNGALTNENIISKKRARRLILKQIYFINEFAENDSANFAVARTPEEVRYLVHNTTKTIFIHSIEGGKRVINSQEDANFWAEQGVAFVTLVHLIDDHNGASATQHGLLTKLINLRGVFRKEKNRGLTERGKQVILWLGKAGIMTDVTHMSDKTRTDAIDFMGEIKLPPISTHDGFKPIQNHPRGTPRSDILKIYQQGGFISLPLSGISLTPHEPIAKYQRAIDSLIGSNCYCEGSIDSYKFTYLAVKSFVESNSGNISAIRAMTYPYSMPLPTSEDFPLFPELSETQKVDFAIGFQSDFNGWLNHHRPRYGKEGCYANADAAYYRKIDPADQSLAPIELLGLAHPGLLESHWIVLEGEGVDLNPIRRASEKFLQVWQYYLNQRD